MPILCANVMAIVSIIGSSPEGLRKKFGPYWFLRCKWQSLEKLFLRRNLAQVKYLSLTMFLISAKEGAGTHCENSLSLIPFHVHIQIHRVETTNFLVSQIFAVNK